MRKLVYFVLLSLVLVFGCNSNKKTDSSNVSDNIESKQRAMAMISFDEGTSYNFGEVKGEAVLTHAFVYRNASDSVPLVIDSIKVGCSCTTFSYPRHPLMPGEQDTIFITYTTSIANPNYFSKSCKVFSNSPYPIELTVSGTSDFETE